MAKKVLFSGIQPTGELHIGNYLGAIKNWVKIQADYDSIFSVVDLHAQTVEYDPQEMPQRVLETAVVLLACGLDPDRCTLFKQSYIPGHCELTWRLATITRIGDLERMTQ
jgi:tryptophanyl-tRNA synthetase